MKYIVLLMLMLACGTTSTWSPHDDALTCTSNMRIIANKEAEFFDAHDRYTPDITELGLPEMVCPTCGYRYSIAVTEDEQEVAIVCPNTPSHGNLKSWINAF